MLVSVCGHKLSMKTIFNYWLESLVKDLLPPALGFLRMFLEFLFSVSVYFFLGLDVRLKKVGK